MARALPAVTAWDAAQWQSRPTGTASDGPLPALPDEKSRPVLCCGRRGGQIQIPAGLVDGIETRLNRTLANSLNYIPFSVSVNHVQASNGVLIITGSRQ